MDSESEASTHHSFADENDSNYDDQENNPFSTNNDLMNLALGNTPAESPMYAPHVGFEIKKQMRELMMEKNNVNVSLTTNPLIGLKRALD